MAQSTRGKKKGNEKQPDQDIRKEFLEIIQTHFAPADGKEQVNEEDGDLNARSKEELILMIRSLSQKCSILEEFQKFKDRTEKKIIELERRQNLNSQYVRRDTIEISGIPRDIKQEALEDEVIRIYDAANVKVHGAKVDKMAIQACHRIGKKQENVVVKFVNRKFATEALYCGKNLKNNSPYNSAVYINNSFCYEYKFLNYCIRNAKKSKLIHRYKVRHGITSIQLEEDGDFFDITHKADLVKYGISVDSDM